MLWGWGHGGCRGVEVWSSGRALQACRHGGVKLLEVPEVMRCVLLCMLEAVEGGLCLLEILEAPKVMCCVLFCMLDAVEGGLSLLEVLEVMRCVLFCAL